MTEVEQRDREIDLIELSEEELWQAIWGAKIGKWNHLRNAEYWSDLENRKPNEKPDTKATV